MGKKGNESASLIGVLAVIIMSIYVIFTNPLQFFETAFNIISFILILILSFFAYMSFPSFNKENFKAKTIEKEKLKDYTPKQKKTEKTKYITEENEIKNKKVIDNEITIRSIDESKNICDSDFEWWNSLEDYWKVNFGYFTNHIIKLEEKGEIDSDFYNKTIFSAGSDLNKIEIFNLPITKDLNKLFQIERLKIYTDSSIKKLPLIKFINLRELNLSIHNNCDLEFLRNLKKIKKLSLSNFFYYKGNLRNLDLEPLKNLKGLIELEIITAGSKINNLDIISENNNLTILKISDYSDENYKIKFDTNFFKKLPKLRKLEISNAVFDNYSSISDKLIELSLTDCSAINASILKKFKVLKKLEVLGKNPIEKSEIEELRKELPNCEITSC